MAVPVARPRLPTSDEILPYLRRIDQSRWYSNGGPLVQEFEARLATHAGDGAVATVANATIGLTLALLTYDLPPDSLCMVPAWTFAATAHAIERAGLVPWIVDVDIESWALNPSMARELLLEAPGPVSVVMPVSPFGQPIDFSTWELFRAETGIPVVIDAAGMFDTIHAGSIPAVVSLHATKALGVGEGGFVVTTDRSFVHETQKRANFGFWGSREATARSGNGKLSEYAAAVGLAGLDRWTETRVDLARVGRAYAAEFAGQSSVALQDGFGDRWISSTVIATLGEGRAATVSRELAGRGIGTRQWWGDGLHRHAAFAQCPRSDLQATEILAGKVIGLPCWRDLPNESIELISQVVISSAG